MKIFIAVITFSILGFIFLLVQNGRKVIQFDIYKILNARPVTTLTGGKLTTWKKGIDGNGLADGYLTMSAAVFNGDKNPHALPDNPVFAANASHPEIKLYYSNKDGRHYQACAISGVEEVEFGVPGNKYKAIYLALTSAEGASALHIKFHYTDGVEEKDFTLPDYYFDIKPGDPDVCYLVHDLAKWGPQNNMTEKDHHNIDLLNIHPDPSRRLKGLSISKNNTAYVVLWAAAGVKSR
jgi:hypothetical protein